MSRPEQRHALGVDGERRARAYLEARGLHCLEAGWRCRLGELDLVMREGDILVFVEVRARQANSAVSALESIDAGKQQRFLRAARAWLGQHPRAAELPARFDIIAIDGEELQWLRDAFSAPSW